MESPWQSVHPSDTVSDLPFRCPQSTLLMVPSAFTAEGWHFAQEAALTGAATARWPAGGMAWQDVQVSAVVLVQIGMAADPVTPLKLKLPWQ